MNYAIVYKDEYTRKEKKYYSPASAVSIIVNGLRQSAEYSFRIFAATSKGNSPPSDVLMAKTEGKPEQSKDKLLLNKFICLLKR